MIDLHIPTLATARLQLQPLDRKHAAGMFELWSQPEVCEYSGPAADIAGEPIELPARTIDSSNRIIDFFLHHQANGCGFRWAACLKDGGFVGAIGFNELGPCAEIAYHLHPDHWGQGLMTEAGRAAISWVTDSYGALSVEAFVEPANVASVELLLRLKFMPAEEQRDGAVRFVLTTG